MRLTDSIKLKICGMRDPDNIRDVVALKPDFMGFILHSGSPRFVSSLSAGMIAGLREQGLVPVAVFVNEPIELMLHDVEIYGFTVVQLHGTELPETCSLLKDRGLTVIKALPVADPVDFKKAMVYENCCHYFLFDTKTSLFGGSGLSYDWNILQYYAGETPFFLSGGIGPDDAARLLSFTHPRLAGIDVNSRFESAPGFKQVDQLQAFIKALRH